MGAAVAVGIEPIVAVYSFSGVTPLTPEARGQFASFAASIPRSLPNVHDVIVGNEPNLNLFWMPQFGTDGSDAAAPAYLALLAETYDAIKGVNPDVNVIGGALASRGSDDPNGKRQTHSPTRFIEDLGAVYRASGRTRPVLDMFSMHPYPENSSIPLELLPLMLVRDTATFPTSNSVIPLEPLLFIFVPETVTSPMLKSYWKCSGLRSGVVSASFSWLPLPMFAFFRMFRPSA